MSRREKLLLELGEHLGFFPFQFIKSIEKYRKSSTCSLAATIYV